MPDPPDQLRSSSESSPAEFPTGADCRALARAYSRPSPRSPLRERPTDTARQRCRLEPAMPGDRPEVRYRGSARVHGVAPPVRGPSLQLDNLPVALRLSLALPA